MKRFPASLDFCFADEHPKNTTRRSQATNLFKEYTLNERMCQEAEDNFSGQAQRKIWERGQKTTKPTYVEASYF